MALLVFATHTEDAVAKALLACTCRQWRSVIGHVSPDSATVQRVADRIHVAPNGCYYGVCPKTFSSRYDLENVHIAYALLTNSRLFQPSLRCTVGSYGLKHCLEDYARKLVKGDVNYSVCNGAAIVAAALAGYRLKSAHGLNCEVYLKECFDLRKFLREFEFSEFEYESRVSSMIFKFHNTPEMIARWACISDKDITSRLLRKKILFDFTHSRLPMLKQWDRETRSDPAVLEFLGNDYEHASDDRIIGFMLRFHYYGDTKKKLRRYMRIPTSSRMRLRGMPE